ncbi:MAG: hypothetical protein ACYTFG_05170 [Planctomycetota bacterium]|jgi:hypothetical protein
MKIARLFLLIPLVGMLLVMGCGGDGSGGEKGSEKSGEEAAQEKPTVAKLTLQVEGIT